MHTWRSLDMACNSVIFHKIDVSERLLGRDPSWSDSCKRPLSLCILGGRLREDRLSLLV